MTREEWIKEREQLGWEFSCLLEDQRNLNKKKEELFERLQQLDSHEPKN